MNYPETFPELLDKYNITIPIIQRDYVQGLNDRIIDELLGDIKNAIENAEQLSLNFVYGKTENTKNSDSLILIPLDGQQRLTTLFLLYLYSLRDIGEKDDKLGRFTYETRRSSREFFLHLCDYTIRTEVLNTDGSPTEAIQEATWFHTKWNFDLTIKSALRCLDKISNMFSSIPNLAEKLETKAQNPVIFKFIPMTDMGMEDSLYIKLNARGRSLTDFETFKADLIAKIESESHLPFTTDDFAINLDVTWSDYFWNLDSKNFDTVYRRYFSLIFGRITNSRSNTFEEDIYADSLCKAFYTLEYLVKYTNQVTEYLKACIKSSQPSYVQRLIFNAIAMFLGKSRAELDEAQLFEWFRFISNMTVNTTIERAQSYITANESIEELSLHYLDIIGYLASEYVLNPNGFSSEQFREERVKAKLILRGHRDIIINAEQHKYFSGQIRSALNMAGLTIGKVHLYTDEELASRIDDFSGIWAKITAIFGDAGPRDGVGFLLRAALLALGEYMPESGQYISFCVDRAEEPTSLKALFSGGHKSVVSLINILSGASFVTIKQELQGIVDNFIAACPPTDWKLWIVKYPQEMFGYLSVSYMRICKTSISYLLVSKYASSSFCREIFTYALYLELKKANKPHCIPNESGRDADYRIESGKYTIRYISGSLTLTDDSGKEVKAPDIPSAVSML